MKLQRLAQAGIYSKVLQLDAVYGALALLSASACAFLLTLPAGCACSGISASSSISLRAAEGMKTMQELHFEN